MVKIKTKKEMNLPEFIEWGFENDVKGSYFAIDRVYAKRIRFESGVLVAMNGEFNKNDTFKIEIEEEITEDTVIPKIAELNLCGYDQHEELFMNENKSINQLLSEEETKNKALYVVNDDYSMTLIWTKEEGLV